MSFRKRFGYAACPAVLLALIFPALSCAQQALPPAQTTQDAAQDQVQPTQQSSTQQRADVLKEAQRRLEQRRRQRMAQVVQQTYNNKYEIYFGGGYIRFRPGQTLQHNQEAAWNTGVTEYLRGNLGVTADFRGYYGSAFTNVHANGVNQGYDPSISQYTFMAGPQYRFYRGEHWGWTAQVLAGAGHGNFTTNLGINLPANLVGVYSNSTALNVDIGASVDYNLSPGLAIRLTPNYLFSNYGGDVQNNKAWQIDLVYRLGKKK
jgi:hypothetical protein